MYGLLKIKNRKFTVSLILLIWLNYILKSLHGSTI